MKYAMLILLLSAVYFQLFYFTLTSFAWKFFFYLAFESSLVSIRPFLFLSIFFPLNAMLRFFFRYLLRSLFLYVYCLFFFFWCVVYCTLSIYNSWKYCGCNCLCLHYYLEYKSLFWVRVHFVSCEYGEPLLL